MPVRKTPTLRPRVVKPPADPKPTTAASERPAKAERSRKSSVTDRLEAQNQRLESTRRETTTRRRERLTQPSVEKARIARSRLDSDQGIALRRQRLDGALTLDEAKRNPLQLAVTNAALLQTPPTGAASADPDAIAAEILDVGDRRFRGDDFDARLEAYAEFNDTADPELREQVLASILEQDPNAFNSWLDFGRINDRAADGTITRAQRATLAETVAGAYNSGRLPTQALPTSPSGEGEIDATALDRVVLGFPADDTYGLGPSDLVRQAEAADDFMAFFAASNGPETQVFRTSYGQHLIDDFVLNDEVSDARQTAAAGMAAELLTGDYQRPEIAVNALAGYSPEQRAQFLDRVADSSAYFNRTHIQGLAEGMFTEVSPRLGFEDGLAEITEAVARVDSPAARGLAQELARLPGRQSGYFEDRYLGADERVRQVGHLTAAHGEAILDELTEYDRTGDRTLGDTDREQYEVNARDLAALLDLTAFNPDSPYDERVQEQLLDYAQGLGERINAADGPNSAGFADAAGRLAVLSAGTSHAVTQAFDDEVAEREAQKKLIGFVVDLALAAVPVGKLASGQIKQALASVFPEGALRDAIDGLSGELVDQATGRLTDAAKAQLEQLVGDDTAGLLERQELQNWLDVAFFAGIDDERDAFNVMTLADSLADDLAD